MEDVSVQIGIESDFTEWPDLTQKNLINNVYKST
jgi:hypothetical protein